MSMCTECHRTPCHPKCPNADEPPAVFICSGCGKNILDGEGYYDVLGEQFCENCIDDSYHVAELEEYFDDFNER